MEEFQGVKVPAPEGWTGDVFVRVVSAVEESWHDSERGNVSEVFPVLIVSTYPFDRGARRDEKGTGVKYRGRTYHVEESQKPTRFRSESRDGWISDHKTYYTRGMSSEAGNPVDWKSPMRDRLRELVAAARDAYVAENPEWATESKRIRLRWMIESADRARDSALSEAERARVLAVKLQAEYDAL